MVAEAGGEEVEEGTDSAWPSDALRFLREDSSMAAIVKLFVVRTANNEATVRDQPSVAVRQTTLAQPSLCTIAAIETRTVTLTCFSQGVALSALRTAVQKLT